MGRHRRAQPVRRHVHRQRCGFHRDPAGPSPSRPASPTCSSPACRPDALHVGDIEFGALISSIQTDEARHSQQGEPTLKILIENGKKAEAQKLVDQMFWRSWRIFGLLTGFSMDYYTPLWNTAP